MQAVVWRGDPDPAKLKVETLRTPTPKTGEVLVKVRACGVCHTDLHCMKGEVKFPAPAVFGHEISGTVVGGGPGVELPIGTKVACPFIMPCGECHFCKHGEEDTCEPFFSMNRLKGHLYDDTTRLFGVDGEEMAMYSFGGLAEYAVVPQTAVFPLTKTLGEGLFAESALLGCAFFTAFGALRNAANLKAGESVCIIGAGGVGTSLVQLARNLGASPVIAVDISDEALSHAKRLGAHHTINSAKEDVVARVAALTSGRRADVCFEVIGLKGTFEQAILAIRDGGKACYVGIADVTAKAEVPITHVVRRRLSLIGSYGARASKDMPELINIASEGGVSLSAAVTHRFPLHDAGAAYARMSKGQLPGRAIVDFGD